MSDEKAILRSPFARPAAEDLSFSEMRMMLDRVGQDPRDVTREDWNQARHSAHVLSIFSDAIERAMTPPEDTVLARTLYAWRLTREIAILRDLIAADEQLFEVRSDRQFDGWYTPEPFRMSQGALSRSHASPEALKAMEMADDLGPNYGQWFEDYLREIQGLALVPPEPPCAYWKVSPEGERTLNDNYDPSLDRLLRLWSVVVNSLAVAMGMGKGKIAEEFDPRLGLYPLLDINSMREAWPARSQIVYFEQALVEEAEKLIVSGTLREARQSLMDRFGLLPYETENLFKMVKAKCREMLEGDEEEHRAIMVLRYEDFIGRCRESLDLSNEVKGLKALSVALGINKIKTNDVVKDIISIISEGAEKRRLEREQNLAMLEDGDGDSPSVGRREIVSEQ
jgi:hypothetical protein